MAAQMSPTARRILEAVCERENLSVEGWEHYMSAMDENGQGVFMYDRGPDSTMRVSTRGDGYVCQLFGSAAASREP